MRNMTYDIMQKIRNNEIMTMDDAKKASTPAGMPSTQPGYRPLAHIFEVVSIETGMVLRSSWTFNRARQNMAPGQVIVHQPSGLVVDYLISDLKEAEYYIATTEEDEDESTWIVFTQRRVGDSIEDVMDDEVLSRSDAQLRAEYLVRNADELGLVEVSIVRFEDEDILKEEIIVWEAAKKSEEVE